jgi:hypothetical protein
MSKDKQNWDAAPAPFHGWGAEHPIAVAADNSEYLTRALEALWRKRTAIDEADAWSRRPLQMPHRSASLKRWP